MGVCFCILLTTDNTIVTHRLKSSTPNPNSMYIKCESEGDFFPKIKTWTSLGIWQFGMACLTFLTKTMRGKFEPKIWLEPRPICTLKEDRLIKKKNAVVDENSKLLLVQFVEVLIASHVRSYMFQIWKFLPQDTNSRTLIDLHLITTLSTAGLINPTYFGDN